MNQLWYRKKSKNTLKKFEILWRMCRSLWLYEINRRKWTWKFIMKFEWRLGLLLSPSSAKAPWCPRETGEREKKKGRKTLLLILLEYPAGTSIWGGAEHRCRSPWSGALISHETLGDKLCPYLFTCRRSNSRERFIPSNQNKVIVLRHTQSHTSAKKFQSAMADRCYVAMSYQPCFLVCQGSIFIGCSYLF